VYHHPRSSSSRNLALSCHQSLRMSTMSLLFCSVTVIRSSVMAKRVCARDWWALSAHPLIDALNRISVNDRSSLFGGTGSTRAFVGVCSIPVTFSIKCNPTLCRLSENVVLMSFLLPFVGLGGGSGDSMPEKSASLAREVKNAGETGR
jgi:hypothetical protein